MGYIFDFKDSLNYDKWLSSPQNHPVVALEQKLMMDMVAPARGRRLLDIGCGSGSRMMPFIEKGVDVTGLDPSPYMIDLGKDRFKHKMEFYRGSGESLPFDDNAFNYVTIIKSLEFVEDPKQVIEEAARVAKNKIFIGIYNRHTLSCAKLRVNALFSESIFRQANFFSIWQLKHMVKIKLGDMPVSYKTTCLINETFRTYLDYIKISSVLERLPFGAFAGIAITPVPRFITTPLILKYKTEKAMSSRVQPMKGSKSG